MTAFRWRAAPNAPWVYVRLEADDGEPLTSEEAGRYILDRLASAGYRSIPWLLVETVDIDRHHEAVFRPWVSAGIFGRGARAVVEPRQFQRIGDS